MDTIERGPVARYARSDWLSSAFTLSVWVLFMLHISLLNRSVYTTTARSMSSFASMAMERVKRSGQAILTSFQALASFPDGTALRPKPARKAIPGHVYESTIGSHPTLTFYGSGDLLNLDKGRSATTTPGL